MPQDAHMNRTSYAFTVSNERADAIGLVASGYSADDLSAEIMPIRTEDEAAEALTRTMRRMGELRDKLQSEDLQQVTERYMKLGENGMSSMVELRVPEGGQNFGWNEFYAEVDTYL